MKTILNLLILTFLFSCQKDNSTEKKLTNSTNNESKNPTNTIKPNKKLQFNEIISQSFSLKIDLNWINAESFVFNVKGPEGTGQMAKLSYFFQDDKLISSRSINSDKGYCELSNIAAADSDGSKINLISNDVLFRSADSRSEEININNLNYKYSSKFKLTFQNTKAVGLLQRPLFDLECFNIVDLAELKSTIGFKFEIKESK